MGIVVSPEQLKASLVSSGKIILRKAVAILVGSLGNIQLPTVTAKVFVVEPSGSGRWSGKHLQFSEVDLATILNTLRTAALEDGAEWCAARNSIQVYIDSSKLRPPLYRLHDVDNHYLRPLLLNYLQGLDSLRYEPRLAHKSVAHLLRHLSSPRIRTTGLIVLEGLGAKNAFYLEPTILVRPIKEAELRLLGRTDSAFPSPQAGLSWPHTDWWVCEVKFSIERGARSDVDDLHEIARILMLALRVFKPGQLSLGVATTLSADGFGHGASWRGGRLQRISMGEEGYDLSDNESIAFVRFWKKFHRLIKKESHYLNLPVRRLLEGGMRSSRADALVDYVIGIEALLGLFDERTELSYRFRVRGSVLLSKRRSERKVNIKILRDLYELRSKIVHGQKVSEEKLETTLPQAENALRCIWCWYFKHFHDKSSNRTGIERIDEELVVN